MWFIMSSLLNNAANRGSASVSHALEPESNKELERRRHFHAIKYVISFIDLFELTDLL